MMHHSLLFSTCRRPLHRNPPHESKDDQDNEHSPKCHKHRCLGRVPDTVQGQMPSPLDERPVGIPPVIRYRIEPADASLAETVPEQMQNVSQAEPGKQPARTTSHEQKQTRPDAMRNATMGPWKMQIPTEYRRRTVNVRQQRPDKERYRVQGENQRRQRRSTNGMEPVITKILNDVACRIRLSMVQSSHADAANTNRGRVCNHMIASFQPNHLQIIKIQPYYKENPLVNQPKPLRVARIASRATPGGYLQDNAEISTERRTKP